MDLFKASVDELAQYIDFLLQFSHSPRQAIDTLVVKDPDAAAKIRPKLLGYMGMSVGLAVVLTLLGAAVGMAPDYSPIVTRIGSIDKKMLPFAVVVLVVISAVVWHGLATAVGWLLARVSNTIPFRGKLAISINAGFAFASWYLPLFTAVLVLIRVAALHLPKVPPAVFLIGVLPLSLLFLSHFVLAFATAHRVSAVYTFTLFGFTFVGLMYLNDLLK